MILENQGNTTLDKYLCKITEFILYDSDESAMSLTELSRAINDRFHLQFDVLEIENAIKNKGKGRIHVFNHKYSLEPKVSNQISSKSDLVEQLKVYIREFIKIYEYNISEEYLLQLMLGFLYFSFNSSVKNFENIIHIKSMRENVNNNQGTLNSPEFNPSSDDTILINTFISWDNNDKNKLLYTIVACSYEYCMITTKKNPAISKKIFNGKRFYLDTNIIFRMAGINKDERRIVIKSFVEKCNEVGIKLLYTNEVFDELYRVIDGQVNYIKSLTFGQVPVDANIVQTLNDPYENNDFYSIYCNWCKEPQNKYNDYLSFRNHLIRLINDTITTFDMVNIPNYKNSKDSTTFSMLSNGLKEYKAKRRPVRLPSDASIQTDINNLMYVSSLKPKEARSLWQINDYIVSADQLFVNWSKNQYTGIPTVMIPSVWLSIILKVSGRATSDDYKSYCAFMTLRQHRASEDDISINPLTLFKILAEKTVEKNIKERIILEIKTNISEYNFSTEDEYDSSVDKAFDKILSEEKMLQKDELAKQAEEQSKKYEKQCLEYEKKIAELNTEEEYAKRTAESRAERKVVKYKENDNIRLVFVGILILVAAFVVVSLFCDVPVVHDLLLGTGKSISKLWTVVAWIFNVLTGSISAYFTAAWKYMGSDERKSKLYKKYYRQQMELLDSKKK